MHGNYHFARPKDRCKKYSDNVYLFNQIAHLYLISHYCSGRLETGMLAENSFASQVFDQSIYAEFYGPFFCQPCPILFPPVSGQPVPPPTPSPFAKRRRRRGRVLCRLEEGHPVPPEVPAKLQGRREGPPAHAAHVLARPERL
jgi:hypothetical protein